MRIVRGAHLPHGFDYRGRFTPRHEAMHAFLAHLGQTLALPALLLAGNVMAAEIWIVTDARNPVAGAQAADRVIQLDAAQAIEADLSAGLPNDPQRAAAGLLAHRGRQPGGEPLHDLAESFCCSDRVDFPPLGEMYGR